MTVFRMSEVCEIETCCEGTVHRIHHTGTFTWSVLHGCGRWTPQEGTYCAFCGDPLDEEDEEAGGEGDDCPAFPPDVPVWSN